jgi:hypothetical protein
MATTKVGQTGWVREILPVSCSSRGADKAPRYSPAKIGQKYILFTECLTYLTYFYEPILGGSTRVIIT